jgi:hypothetical protein
MDWATIFFPRTMAERLDQLIQFRLRKTISPILQPVENINSKTMPFPLD